MPSIQKASSVLNLLGTELENTAPMDHWHVNELSGHLRVVGGPSLLGNCIHSLYLSLLVAKEALASKD